MSRFLTAPTRILVTFKCNGTPIPHNDYSLQKVSKGDIDCKTLSQGKEMKERDQNKITISRQGTEMKIFLSCIIIPHVFKVNRCLIIKRHEEWSHCFTPKTLRINSVHIDLTQNESTVYLTFSSVEDISYRQPLNLACIMT